jgi:hypothetical protein
MTHEYHLHETAEAGLWEDGKLSQLTAMNTKFYKEDHKMLQITELNMVWYLFLNMMQPEWTPGNWEANCSKWDALKKSRLPDCKHQISVHKMHNLKGATLESSTVGNDSKLAAIVSP